MACVCVLPMHFYINSLKMKFSQFEIFDIGRNESCKDDNFHCR